VQSRHVRLVRRKDGLLSLLGGRLLIRRPKDVVRRRRGHTAKLIDRYRIVIQLGVKLVPRRASPMLDDLVLDFVLLDFAVLDDRSGQMPDRLRPGFGMAPPAA
jgi:hypothetical protein